MFDQDYSKRVWIISIVMAIGAIIMDIFLLLGEDGIMKDTEIYNIFDTDKILNRSAEVAISNTSGAAGVAYWINKHLGLEGENAVDKRSPLVIKVKEEIDRIYDDGRTTFMGDEELMQIVKSFQAQEKCK